MIEIIKEHLTEIEQNDFKYLEKLDESLTMWILERCKIEKSVDNNERKKSLPYTRDILPQNEELLLKQRIDTLNKYIKEAFSRKKEVKNRIEYYKPLYYEDN